MRYLPLLSTFLGLVSAASISLEPRQSSSGACNNSPQLCGKPYGTVVHLGCHDSPFTRDATTGFSTSGNQYYNSTVQLSAGVRLLTAQVHKSNGGWHLCHSSCDLLDVGTLSNWLKSIKLWMDANPNEVVTVLIVNSDNAAPSDLHTEFVNSGITTYAYKPPTLTAPIPGANWPTLGSMISSGQRLVVFVASVDATQLGPDMNYMMPEFQFIFENKYENLAFTDFSCDVDRPTNLALADAISGGRMPMMNHFLYQSLGGGILSSIETPNVDNITITNSPNTTTVGMLGYSADNCKSQYGKPPTFILVDFFDEGPAIQTVDRLNGVSSPVGRTPLPPRPTRTAGNAASWAGVQQLVEEVMNGQAPSLGAWIWGSGKWSLGGINLSGGDVLA